MAPVVQPEASVVQVGLGIRYVGEYCYAYSGLVSIDDNETTLLEFRTGSGVIRALTDFNYAESQQDIYRMKIYFNDLAVQAFIAYGKLNYKDSSEVPIPLIIPPFTLVKCTGQNIDNTNAREHIVSLTGRVYGVE